MLAGCLFVDPAFRRGRLSTGGPSGSPSETVSKNYCIDVSHFIWPIKDCLGHIFLGPICCIKSGPSKTFNTGLKINFPVGYSLFRVFLIFERHQCTFLHFRYLHDEPILCTDQVQGPGADSIVQSTHHARGPGFPHHLNLLWVLS